MDSVQDFGSWGEGSSPSGGTMKKLSILFLIIFLGILFLPLMSSAAGLVPCGGESEPACQFCHLFAMFQKIIDFVLVYLVFPAATLLIIIGGIRFFLYAENPEEVEKAKSMLTATIIGLVIIFSSWLVVGLFLTAVGLSTFTVSSIWPSDWFTINCPI
jgi:hypothetical protein